MSLWRKFVLGVVLGAGVATGMAVDAAPVQAARARQLHLGPYKNRADADRTAVLWRRLGWKTQVYYVRNHPSGPGWILHVWK